MSEWVGEWVSQDVRGMLHLDCTNSGSSANKTKALTNAFFVYFFIMNNLINYIKSIDFNSLLDRANLIIFSIVVLSVGFLGWIPLMLVLQYFSTAYLLYTFVFKVLTKIPGFTYMQLLYLELITIFPIIDVVLKTVNPFYN